MLKADNECIKEEDRVMTIETKYNIGDELWVKRKGQASEGIIVSITAFADCLYDFKALRIPYDIRPIITLYKKQKPRKPQLLAYTGLI